MLMDTSMLPTLVPSRPWLCHHDGGYLTTPGNVSFKYLLFLHFTMMHLAHAQLLCSTDNALSGRLFRSRCSASKKFA